MNGGIDDIKTGQTVTILIPAGMGRRGQEWKEASGRATMLGPAGWVLNMGGPHGTPGVCTDKNFVRIGPVLDTRPHYGDL